MAFRGLIARNEWATSARGRDSGDGAMGRSRPDAKRREDFSQDQNLAADRGYGPAPGKKKVALPPAPKRKTFGADQTSDDTKRARNVPFNDVSNNNKGRPLAIVPPRNSAVRPASSRPEVKGPVKVSVRPTPKQAVCNGALKIPVPKALTRIEKAVDLHRLACAIDHISAKPPQGVEDLDEKCDSSNFFSCPTYAHDVVTYIKGLEQKYVVRAAYKNNLKPSTRAILADWLVQVQSHLALNSLTLHMTLAMVDEYLMRETLPIGEVQLLGITCLLVAAKIEERFAPRISKLLHLTDNSYKYSDVIAMELRVLRVLNFEIHLPTVPHFIDRAFIVVGYTDKIDVLGNYLADLGLPAVRVMDFSPSLRAAAIAYLAKATVDGALPTSASAPWLAALTYYLGHDLKDVRAAASRYAKLLLRAPQDRYQGALSKFGSRSFQGVSKWPSLTSDVVNMIAENVNPDAPETVL